MAQKLIGVRCEKCGAEVTMVANPKLAATQRAMLDRAAKDHAQECDGRVVPFTPGGEA